MIVDASVLNVVHWTLPRMGDAPMATKMAILYTILAGVAVYFLLPLFLIVFTKVRPRYWLLWALYYLVATGLACYVASSLGVGAVITLIPWAIGLVLRMQIPASQARGTPTSSVESTSPTV